MDKFSAFIGIIPFEDLKLQFDLIPKSWKMYVKCDMESPGTRKCVFITNNKVSIEHVANVVHLAIEIGPTYCNNGKARHILRTKYIRWRSWMKESEYLKLSEKQRQRSKFLNRPWLPSKTSESRVHNFFEERLKK